MSRIRYRSISGSLLVTGSVSGNTLTFEKGDGTSFELRVDTGSGGGVATDITDLNNFTGSANTRFDNLEAATGSYLISDDTGSLVYSGSFDGVSTLTLYLPDGNLDLDLSALVGGSTDISALNLFTGSAESRLDSIEGLTGSLATTGSNTFTGSQFFSGSLIPEATDSENGIYDLGSVQNPWRDLYLTTSSLNFVKDGEIFSVLSGEKDAIRVGNVLITTASLAFVNNEGDVVSNIAVAQESGSEVVGGDILETGSLLVTGSVSGNVITLTKGDGTGFTLTVDTGSGGGESTDISALNTFTGSIQTEVDTLTAATSSYLVNADTGSFYVSSSVSLNTITFTQGDGTTESVTIDTGSNSTPTDISALNTFTGSAESRLDSIEGATGSFVTNDQTGSFLVGSDTGSLLATGSVSNNVITLEKADGTSFTLTVATGSGQPVPDGTVSSSAQIEAVIDDNYISASAAASGFGSGGGDSTDISALNTFTGSAESRLDSIEAATSSFLGSSDTGSLLVTASVASNTITLEKGDGTSFNLTVDTGSTAETASFVDTLSNFNGNRIVSNTNLPSGIYNVNFGASGSLSNFIEKVFFPNSAPSISASFFRIEEFVVSGSSIGTISATDAEGQTITFSTASSYTDDFFRIHSGSGEITLNTKSTASMNTTLTPDSVQTPASQSHAFTVEATDTFGGTSSAIIYIHVNPNTAPLWRSTSVNGNVINTFTQSLNENSVSGNNKARVFYTDSEGDTITIGTGSLSSTFTDAFSLTVESTYVQLNQVTASLDFETTPIYEFVLTASDEHYQDGDDTESIKYLPFQVAVGDNFGPSVNDQTLSTINENSSDGASVGSITATDTEGDTIIFSNFTLVRAYVNGVGTNVTSSMGGTGLDDPTADAFQSDINGNVTRRNSVFLNADVADRYEYRVTVTDAFNSTTDTGLITIPIGDDAASPIGVDGQNYYIIESAVQGDNLTTETDGYSSGNVTLSSAVSQRWEVNTVPAGFVRFTTGNTYATASSVTLEVDSNISGSSNTAGDTIAIQITASENNFHTTKQFRDHTLNVTANEAPDIIFTNTSANLNTNGARPSNTLTTITFNDASSDALNHDTFQFTDASGQLEASKSGDTYLVRATSNLSASSYIFSASIEDVHGFNTNTEGHSISINQAPIGTLTTNGTFYIIESALSSSNVVLDSNGRTGTQGDLGVSYIPNYNSPTVQSFTSSNAAIAVDSSGGLTLALNLSGSTTGSGDTITSDITFRDQYDNIGSGSITINVAENQAPEAVFTDQLSNFTASVATNTYLVGVTISDDESDTPFSMSLSGTDASSLKAVPQNADSSSYQIQAASTLSAADYSYTASIFDSFGKSRSYNEEFTIVPQKGLVYGYGINWAAGPNSEATFFGSAGDSGGDGVGIESGSLIAMLQSGSIGGTFSTSYGAAATVTLYHSASLTTLSDTNTSGVSSLGYFDFSSTSQHVLIVFPSASNQAGKRATMYDGVPPDSTPTADEYYLYAKDAAIPGTVAAGIYYFDVENTTEGSDTWGFIFTEGKNTNNSRYYLMPDSASAP